MSSIQIQKNNIVHMNTDCIVNAANSYLLAGGGVCGAIFHHAGHDQLTKACQAIGYCPTGDAIITPGFQLKSSYIIHAVGPKWQGGHCQEEQLLYSCYQKALDLALKNHCHSIAFPLISSGIYGYPIKQAWQIAICSCTDFIDHHPYDIDIIFTVIDNQMEELGNVVMNEHYQDIYKFKSIEKRV